MTSVRPEKTQYSLRDLFSYVGRPLAQIRKVVGLKGDEDLAYRLSVAGYREPHDIDTFLDTKVLMPVMGVLLGTFVGGSNVLLACLLLGAGGYFVPDFFLIQAIKKRKTAIARSLPDALDLLVICIEAGLGMDQAVLRVAQEFQPVSPELSTELTIVCHEQRAGKPRIEAWHSLADRVDLDTIRHFAGMLTQSERLGTPIARALSQFADSLRTKRIMQAEEQAAKTPVKLLFRLSFAFSRQCSSSFLGRQDSC